MGKTTEEKAAELRAEAREHRAENYAVKRRAGCCGEEGCSERNQLLVVETSQGEVEGEGPSLGVRCPLHLGDYPIRPFQFNEDSMADRPA